MGRSRTFAFNYATLLLLSMALEVTLFQLSSLLEYSPLASFWYPPAGLTVALFLLLGSRAFPIVLLCTAVTTLLSTSILERGLADPALSIFELFCYSLTHVVPYWAGVSLLQRTTNGLFDPRNPSHILGFLIVMPFSAAGAAFLGISFLHLLGNAPFIHVTDILAAWWIGDMVAVVCLSIAIAYLLLMVLAMIGADLGYRLVYEDDAHQKHLNLGDLSYLPLALVLLFAGAFLSYSYPEKLGLSFPVYTTAVALLLTLYKTRSPIVYLVLAVLSFALASSASAFGLLANAAEYQVAMIAVGSITYFTNAAVSSQRKALALSEQVNKRLLTEIHEKWALKAHAEDLQRKKLEAARQSEAALRESHKELERRAARLAHLTSELTLAEQRERGRLVKVLHDHLQQLLVAATLGLDGLGRRLSLATSETKSDAKTALDKVKALLDQAIVTTRTLVADLCPPILHDSGLSDALMWLARSMQDRHALRVDLNLDVDASPVREDVRNVVFEAVRESLFNVVKHAQCERVEVTVSQHQQDSVRILVEDSGVGFDVARLNQEHSDGSGAGMLSMRERLRLLGGECTIVSEPGVGTRVTLIAPLGA